WMPPVAPGDSAGDLVFEYVFFQYDEIVWRVAYYGFARPRFGDDQISTDRAFRGFALDVIRAAPDQYAVVVLHSFTRSVIYTVAGRHVTLLALFLFLGTLAVAGLARAQAGWPRTAPDPGAARREAGWLELVAVPALVLWLVQVFIMV